MMLPIGFVELELLEVDPPAIAEISLLINEEMIDCAEDALVADAAPEAEVLPEADEVVPEFAVVPEAAEVLAVRLLIKF
jgi:hypothetical protein